MGEAQYAHNHTIDPETGFLESKAYPYAFDADRKKAFLTVYQQNGLDIYTTCEMVGVERKTVIKHYHKDPAFKAAFDEAEGQYVSKLEGKSRLNAMCDRSVVERLFQLNSFSRKGLTSGKYTDEKSGGSTIVNISIDGKMIEALTKKVEVVDVTCIDADDSLLSGYAQPALPDSPTETPQ